VAIGAKRTRLVAGAAQAEVRAAHLPRAATATVKKSLPDLALGIRWTARSVKYRLNEQFKSAGLFYAWSCCSGHRRDPLLCTGRPPITPQGPGFQAARPTACIRASRVRAPLFSG
jgi:hypothetical protein